MYYLDTSVLLPLYRQEDGTTVAEKLLETASTPPAISVLTQVEVTSVLARHVRTGELTSEQARAVEQTFTQDLDNGVLRRVAFHEHCYWQARHWLGQFTTSLRSMDALHLACATDHNLILASADRALAHAATELETQTQLLTPTT